MDLIMGPNLCHTPIVSLTLAKIACGDKFKFCVALFVSKVNLQQSTSKNLSLRLANIYNHLLTDCFG